jgi:hypothetical protein
MAKQPTEAARAVYAESVSVTLALAILGAVTGVAGLAWQIVSFAFSGARIEVVSQCWTKETSTSGPPHWWVRTTVSNVGRLDAPIVGYSLWMDVRGHWLARLRWQLAAWRRLGWRTRRRLLLAFSPVIHVSAPGVIEKDGLRVDLPVVIKAGEMIDFPPIAGLRRNLENDSSLLRVAVLLGSGRIVKARPRRTDEIKPLEITLDDQGDVYVEGGTTAGGIKVLDPDRYQER